MAYCPACKNEWDSGSTECPICGKELAEPTSEQPWVVVGSIADKISADFARETLRTYEIPAVVVSKAGFFGTMGMTMTHFYSGTAARFEVSAPPGSEEEVDELLRMIIGDRWQRKEN